jgi:hypothetical protein
MAHLYETGRLRRVHLREHGNIIKPLLIHACSLNLGLLMRSLYEVGTPRGLQDSGLQPPLMSLLLLASSYTTDAAQTTTVRVISGRYETSVHLSAFPPIQPIQL